MNPPDRLNRALLTLLALLLIALGGAGLAAGLDAFGSQFAHRTVLDNAFSRYVGRHGSWVWPLIAVATILIALAALRWLATQASSERAGTTRVPGETGHGTTTLRASALSDAVANQIAGYRGVHGAKARLLGDTGNERLDLSITVADRVHFDDVRTRIETQAVADARTALDDPAFPVTVTYDITTKAPARDL